MVKNIVQLYSLAICLVLSLASVIIIILLTISVVDLNFFAYRHNNELSNFRDIDSYNSSFIAQKYQNHTKNLTDFQLLKFIDKERVNYIDSQKIKLKNNMIDYTIYLIIVSIFISIHYKIYQTSIK